MTPNSITPGDSVERLDPNPRVNHSSMSLSYEFDHTSRFGDITPFFVANAVPGDKIPLRCISEVRSMNMQSPISQTINKRTTHVNVPKEVLFPINSEKLTKNPLIGDDVDPFQAGPVVEEFVNQVSDTLANWHGAILRGVFQNTAWHVCQFMLMCERFYSTGSLISYLGMPMHSLFKNLDPGLTGSGSDFDHTFDRFAGSLLGCTISWYSDRTVVRSITPNDSSDIRRALELMRDNPEFNVSDPYQNITGWFMNVAGEFEFGGNDSPINLSRLFAYQVACAHFFSNDHIDYIYSAQLWRDNLGSLISSFTAPAGRYFTYNGISVQYDWCSAKFVNDSFAKVNSLITAGTSDIFDWFAVINYFSYIFSYRRSLKYVDYFTGSRSNPLALGDVNVAVAGNKVSIIDVTKKIQVQRFLNNVNKAGQRFRDYMKGVFGVEPGYDFHDPAFLGSTSSTVFGSEIENTGAAQVSLENSTTTVLRGNANDMCFEFDSDRYSIIIGLEYYDIKRMYSEAVDRDFFHVDRFDDWVPEMEYVGDQPLYLKELGLRHADNVIFAYQSRYQEFKQRIDRAAGGFVNYLPSWSFLAEDKINADILDGDTHISPEYIRSSNTELDKFFRILTHYSLGGYWHFIVVCKNECKAARPMTRNAGILQ